MGICAPASGFQLMPPFSSNTAQPAFAKGFFHSAINLYFCRNAIRTHSPLTCRKKSPDLLYSPNSWFYFPSIQRTLEKPLYKLTYQEEKEEKRFLSPLRCNLRMTKMVDLPTVKTLVKKPKPVFPERSVLSLRGLSICNKLQLCFKLACPELLFSDKGKGAFI